MKKLVALLLAILMLMGTLTMIACGDEKNPDAGKVDDPKTDDPKTDDPKTDDPKTDDPKTDDPKTDDPVTDDPKTDDPTTDDGDEYAILSKSFDFSGADEVVLVWESGLSYVEDPDKLNDGDKLEMAKYKRQTEIEEKLGVNFNVIDNGSAETFDVVSTSVKSGTHEYDMLTAHMKFGGSIALENSLRNINKFPYIDLSKTWWNQSVNEHFLYKTVQYWATGDITTGYINNLVCVFVDDKLFESYTTKKIDELFAEVQAGQWTAEKVLAYTNGVYADANGDSTRNEGDLFGWYYDNTGWVVSALASSLGYSYSQPSGKKYVINLSGAENEHIFEKAKELIKSDGFHPASSNAVGLFNDGLSIFAHQTVDAIGSLRARVDDFSIIPMPKLVETDEYKTPSYDGLNLFGIVGTEPLERYELIGAFVEMFAAMGRKYVTEALFKETLKAKYSRNEGSYKCLDIIRVSGYCDFAFCWTGPLGQIDIFLSNAVMGNASSLASAAESQQATFEKRLKNIYSKLEELNKADVTQVE